MLGSWQNASASVCAGLFLSLGVVIATGGEVRVLAATSLTESLKAVAEAYGRQTKHPVVLQFGASNLLARQIEEGAPADIFISADQASMDALAKRALISPGTQRTLLSNSLVIVVATERGAALRHPADLAEPFVTRIALADPRAVPAGVYAREYLESLGLWNKVSKKVVPCENVRAALAALASGNVDAAIVYKTDSMVSRKARVAFEVPAGQGPRISYPVARLKGSTNPKGAENFLAFLNSRVAQEIFLKNGFMTAPATQQRP